MAQFPFKDGDKILFQGDSITDCGRREDPFGIGTGYVSIIKGALAAATRGARIEIKNRGVSGDRSIELVNRWKEDCLDLHPTHVSIMVGVNDIWHDNVGRGISAAGYRANMRHIVERTIAAGIGLILVTPTTVDADPAHPYNVQCAEYAAAVEAFAREYGAVFVNAREAMWRAVGAGPSVEYYLPDGVHPSVAGHAVIAAAWLEAVGVIR